MDQDPAQPVLDRQGFQQRLPLGRLDVDVTGREVREPSGLVDFRENLVDRLLRQPHLPAQLRGTLPRLPVEGEKCRIGRIERLHLLRRLHGRFEVALLVGGVAQRDPAGLSFEQEPDSAETPLHGRQRRDRPDREELLRSDLVAVLALGDREDPLVVPVHGSVDRSQGAGAAGVDRKPDSREENRVAHRDDRQIERFRHSISFREEILLLPSTSMNMKNTGPSDVGVRLPVRPTLSCPENGAAASSPGEIPHPLEHRRIPRDSDAFATPDIPAAERIKAGTEQAPSGDDRKNACPCDPFRPDCWRTT